MAAVATLDPDEAAKMAHEPMFECIVPPGSQESLPKKGFLHPSFPALKASLVLKKRNPKNNTVIEALANVVLDVAKTTTRATALRDRGTSRVETNSM